MRTDFKHGQVWAVPGSEGWGRMSTITRIYTVRQLPDGGFFIPLSSWQPMNAWRESDHSISKLPVSSQDTGQLEVGHLIGLFHLETIINLPR